MASRKDVQMQVTHGLTAIRPLIDNDAVTLTLALKTPADIGCGREQLGF